MSFPRYPEYKDSGVEWLGQVPAHWTAIPFRRAVTIAEGQVDPRNSELATLPLIAPNHIEGGTGRILAVESAGDQGAQSGKYEVRKGDVVYSKIRPSLRKVCVAPTDGLCSADMYPIRPRGQLNGRFLYWWLLSEPFSAYAVLESDRVAMPKINRDSLNAAVIVLPSEAEQSTIVAFLDRETAKIDALVAEQERLIALLKEKRQAVISHAVTKGLNPDAPRKDSGIHWLGDIPSHWSVIQSRRLFRVRSEKALPFDEQLTASQRYGIIRQADFVEREGRRVVETILGKENLLHVEPDDFVISMRSFQGGIERSTLRGSISFHYVMLVPRSQVFPPFFAYVLKCRPYIHALQSTTDLIRDGQELRFSHFVQVPLPLLPLSEQQEIAEFLDRELHRMDSLISHAEESLPLLHERRRALITAAVTGQIDVRSLASAEAA